MELAPDAEEIATFYAGVPVDGLQLGDPKVAKLFNKNFMRDFKDALGPKHVIKDLAKCDFDVRKGDGSHPNRKCTATVGGLLTWVGRLGR